MVDRMKREIHNLERPAEHQNTKRSPGPVVAARWVGAVAIATSALVGVTTLISAAILFGVTFSETTRVVLAIMLSSGALALAWMIARAPAQRPLPEKATREAFFW
jgi:hypothetical protein